ncbi:MAG: ABC transporter permease [Acidobacteriota bacterium]
MIRRILHLGANELRLALKDRTALIWMVIMPIAFIIFFGSVSGGSRDAPSNATIDLNIADQDLTWLSRALVDALQGADFRLHEPRTSEDLLADDRGDPTLVIPAGLNEAVARGEPVPIFLATPADASSTAGLAAETHVLRALIELLGTVVQMQSVAGADQPLDLQADLLAEYRRLSGAPPLVTVKTSYAGSGREPPSGFGQSIPGMMTQFIIMITLISGAVYLTQEKASGVLRRLAVSALTPRTLIAGKLVGLVFLALLQAGILIAAGWTIGRLGLFGATFYWGEAPAALFGLLLAFSVCAAGLTLFFGAILSTPAQASGVGWLTGMIMAGLGGCWWPLEVTPRWLQTAGHVLPTAWMMDGLHAVVSFGKGLSDVMPQIAILLAYGLVFAALGAWRLKVS